MLIFFQFTGKQQQNKPVIIYNIIFIFKSLELQCILKTVFAKIQLIKQSRSLGNDRSPTHLLASGNFGWQVRSTLYSPVWRVTVVRRVGT